MCGLQVSCLIGFVVFLSLFKAGYGSRILLAPFPFQSHVGQFMNIGEGLLDRGHDVYILTSPTLPSLDKVKKSRMKVITYIADEPDFYSGSSDTDMADFLVKIMDIKIKEDFRTTIEGFKQLCSNPLKDQRLFETLHDLKLDLAIVDTFPCGRCMLVLMHRLGLPFVNLKTGIEPWLLRNPALPSVRPFMLGDMPYTPKMTFWQRLENLWSIIDWSVFTGVEYIEDSFLEKYFYETTPIPLNKLAGHGLLWLIDQTPLMDYPSPTMPNEIHVGGLTTKPAKPLTDDLEKFMTSNSEGVVVVSFGSMGNDLPEKTFDELIAAFELVPYNVIMRFPTEKLVKKVSPHIKLLSWLPQNDLLGHNNTRLFITHCGANGQVEGLYHGLPMIGFPMFAEQHYNALRSTYHGFGVHLDLRTFKSKDLAANISEVIENPTYVANIRSASNIFRDQPMTPRETALYWIEHVLKHGGAHLRPHALDMVWYEYLMLDIMAFVLCVAITVTVIAVSLIKKMVSLLCGVNGKQKRE